MMLKNILTLSVFFCSDRRIDVGKKKQRRYQNSCIYKSQRLYPRLCSKKAPHLKDVSGLINHYNKDYTGKYVWRLDDERMFDNYMIKCLQLYLEKLQKSEFVNKVRDYHEFIEWCGVLETIKK